MLPSYSRDDSQLTLEELERIEQRHQRSVREAHYAMITQQPHAANGLGSMGGMSQSLQDQLDANYRAALGASLKNYGLPSPGKGGGVGAAALIAPTIPVPPRPLVEVANTVYKKTHDAIGRLINELPYNVCRAIRNIQFFDTDAAGPRYVVTFNAPQDALTFENVNEFPTDADIAHICLVAP